MGRFVALGFAALAIAASGCSNRTDQFARFCSEARSHKAALDGGGSGLSAELLRLREDAPAEVRPIFDELTRSANSAAGSDAAAAALSDLDVVVRRSGELEAVHRLLADRCGLEVSLRTG